MNDLPLAPMTDAYTPPDDEMLRLLEASIMAQLARPDQQELKLLGYGEVTIAIAVPAAAPRWACKRMPPLSHVAQLRAYANHIDTYVAELGLAGVHVLPTRCHIVPSYPGRYVLILSQPIIESNQLGPAILHGRQPDPADPFLNAIFDTVCASASPRIGLDAQLANWALVDDNIWQIDVSTPFTCDAQGQPELDTSLVVQPFPAFLRPALRRWIVPPLLKRYHVPRLALLDFVGNLFKERLDQWVEPALEAANSRLSDGISLSEARAYYDEDARLWEVIYRVKKASRFMTNMIGGTYQFLLPPPTDR
jgi:hypothetical protein